MQFKNMLVIAETNPRKVGQGEKTFDVKTLKVLEQGQGACSTQFRFDVFGDNEYFGRQLSGQFVDIDVTFVKGFTPVNVKGSKVVQGETTIELKGKIVAARAQSLPQPPRDLRQAA